MSTIHTKKVKTRKPHHCWGCAKKFPKGTEMRTTTEVEDGIISNIYWCKDCQDFVDSLSNDEIGDGFYFGEVKSLIKERINGKV